MGKACSWSLISIFIIILSCCVSEMHGNKQARALDKFFKARLKAGSQINRGHFEAPEIVHEAATATATAADVGSQAGLKEKDRIVSLPGQPKVNFSQYGGYVTVNHLAGRAYYYYFVEAQTSKETKPLLLWLNGGPGCSSLAYGAMQELGPFRVNSDGRTLYLNRYRWNHAANVLFLESPTGVGFSYSNRSSDYADYYNDDKKTAADNYVFLVNWLERFPEYKKRDFFIAGESYAGHYVPELAHTILYHNKKANKTIVNLKGILIGNAVINDETDDAGMYDFLASHAIISDNVAHDINTYCYHKSSDPSDQRSLQCDTAWDAFYRATRFIDIYNIYAPLFCRNESLTKRPKKHSLVADPCSDNYVIAYLNRAEVQEAIHANVTKLKYDWQPCSGVMGRWGDSPSTMLPLLHEFLHNGLRVWIFSGDIDGRVPVTSTKYSLKKMNLSVETAWHPWYLFAEAGGYTEVYKGGLTFATVRGAGHQVPSYQPARAFSLLKHFLDGTPLPDTTRYT